MSKPLFSYVSRIVCTCTKGLPALTLTLGMVALFATTSVLATGYGNFLRIAAKTAKTIVTKKVPAAKKADRAAAGNPMASTAEVASNTEPHSGSPLAVATPTPSCVNDLQGADDEPGQKDLNQFCVQTSSCGGSGEFTAAWNWDDLQVNGNNTLDACSLYDTDGDGNANFALCVATTDGIVFTTVLYSCGDTRPDRCTSQVTIIPTVHSTCSLSKPAGSDPFSADHGNNDCSGTNCKTVDLVASCCIDTLDFGGSNANLLDVCSYPSGQPNSDPSDCVVTGGCSTDSDCESEGVCDNATCDNTVQINGKGICRHRPKSSTTICRASAGDCDVAESCNGTDVTCPADGFKSATTECRASAGDCDVAESCTGSSAACPADGFKSATTECRASAGDCDVAESCTGNSAACPADGFKPSTTECRGSAGACDVAENCTGSSAACPADGFKSATTECRASAGACDVAESCTGSSAACPADGFKSATTECRASAGACDVAESCTGSSAACPADGFKSATTICRPSADECDPAESCTGSSASCPADTGGQCNFRDEPQIAPTGTTCQQYRDSTSTTLTSILYTLTKGNPASQTINSVSPGVFFLYDGVHMASNGSISVTETIPTADLWNRVIPVNGTQVILYDLNCNIVRNYSNNAAGLIIGSDGAGNYVLTLNSVPIPAGDYILAVKYDPTALGGYHPPSVSTTYAFSVSANGVSSGSTGVLVNKKK